MISAPRGSGAYNINASLVPAGHIKGTVKSASGAAFTGAIAVTPYIYTNGSWEWVLPQVIYTDNSGGYDLGWLPAGTYHVEFWDWTGTYGTEYYSEALNLQAARGASLWLRDSRRSASMRF